MTVRAATPLRSKQIDGVRRSALSAVFRFSPPPSAHHMQVRLEGAEAVANKSVSLRLDALVEVSQHVRAERSDKAHDRALLNLEPPGSGEQRLHSRAIAHRHPEHRSRAFEGSAERRPNQPLRDQREIPIGLAL